MRFHRRVSGDSLIGDCHGTPGLTRLRRAYRAHACCNGVCVCRHPAPSATGCAAEAPWWWPWALATRWQSSTPGTALGELSYEVWCHPEGALGVWNAIQEAGRRAHDLKPLGLEALDWFRIEAGLASGDQGAPRPAIFGRCCWRAPVMRIRAAPGPTKV